MYNDKYIKTKISLTTYFHNNKMPRENLRYTCLSVILLDSIINVDTEYYPDRTGLLGLVGEITLLTLGPGFPRTVHFTLLHFTPLHALLYTH